MEGLISDKDVSSLSARLRSGVWADLQGLSESSGVLQSRTNDQKALSHPTPGFEGGGSRIQQSAN